MRWQAWLSHNPTVMSIRRIAYRIQAWFGYQHIAALLLILVGLTLYRRRLTELDAAMLLLGIDYDSQAFTLLFIFCAGVLVGQRRPTIIYRLVTLPLAILGLIILWYDVVYLNLVSIAAIYGLGMWALLQLFGTRPEDDLPPGKG